MTAPTRPFDVAKTSLIGSRGNNQDRCQVLYNGDAVLLGLGDGLGGHPRGDVAAQLLMDVCEHRFRRAPIPLADPSRFMLACIGQAHEAILRFGRRQDPPIAPRTTAVIVVVQKSIAYWSHVGDSRLYLIRDASVVGQTRDHRMLRVARDSPDRPARLRTSLTRCLGGLIAPPLTTCAPPTRLQRGDTLLLCSDGLWGQLPTDAVIEAFADRRAPIDEQLQALASQAVQTPNSDNVTAVALRWNRP